MSDTTTALPLAWRLERIVEDERFKRAVLALIVINAVLLGFETSRTLPASVMNSIMIANQAILGAFVVELILRIGAYRLDFLATRGACLTSRLSLSD